MVKNPPANAGDVRDPWVGKTPGGGNGNPLQDSSLENPMDRGAWRATVHAVAKSQTRLSDLEHIVRNWPMCSCRLGGPSVCTLEAQAPGLRTRGAMSKGRRWVSSREDLPFLCLVSSHSAEAATSTQPTASNFNLLWTHPETKSISHWDSQDSGTLTWNETSQHSRKRQS